MAIQSQAPLKDPIHPMKVNPYHAAIRLEEFTPDFEKMTKKLEAFWKAQGVEWKFGIEHEFQWGDVEGDATQEAEDIEQGEISSDLRNPEKKLDDSNNRLRHYAAHLKEIEQELKELSPEDCREMLLELRQEYQIGLGITDAVTYTSVPEISAGSSFLDVTKPDAERSSAEMVRDEAMMVTRMYRNRLGLRDELRKHFDDQLAKAQKDHHPQSPQVTEAKSKREAIETFQLREMIMCWMHELSPLKDKLEYVFGKAMGGEGYYDNSNVGEMRLKPVLPSEAAMLQRELVITLSQAAYDYGIGLRHAPNPHLHISAHKGGQTLTDSRVTQAVIHMPDKDGLPDPQKAVQLSHQTFREQMINGMLALGHNTMPMWRSGHPFRSDQFVMLTGQSRRNSIRQLPNRVELRLGTHANLNPNIVELVALALAGATHGLTHSLEAHKEATALGATHAYHGRFRHVKHPDFSPAQLELLQDLLSVSNFVSDAPESRVKLKQYCLKPSRNEELLIDDYFGLIAGLMQLPEGELTKELFKKELGKIKITPQEASGIAKAAPRLTIEYVGENKMLKKALSAIACDRLVPGVFFSDDALIERQIKPLIAPLDGSDQPDASSKEQQAKLLTTMKNSPHVQAVFKQWGNDGLYDRLMNWTGDWFPTQTPDFKLSDVRYRERISERHLPKPSHNVMH